MKPGAIVMLKSGSPLMVVKTDNGDEKVCVWYNPQTVATIGTQPNAPFFEASFSVDTLIEITPAAK